MSYKGNITYKWNNAFEAKFPSEGDLNEKLMVVKVGEGTWKNTETIFEKNFYLYTFEIIVKTFPTEKNPSPKDQNISVTRSEVEWFFDKLGSQTKLHFSYGPKRLLQITRLNNQDISITSIEKDKVHGICLTSHQVDYLLESWSLIKFIVENQNINDTKMNPYIFGLLASLVGSHVDKQIKNADSNKSDENKRCRIQINLNPNVGSYIAKALADPELDLEFKKKLRNLFDMLSISPTTRKECENILIPRLKLDVTSILEEVEQFLDGQVGEAYRMNNIFKLYDKLTNN